MTREEEITIEIKVLRRILEMFGTDAWCDYCDGDDHVSLRIGDMIRTLKIKQDSLKRARP